jgi:hypothetical protein
MTARAATLPPGPLPLDALDSLAGTGKVRIYRMRPDGKRLQVGLLERDMVVSDLDQIPQRWGGGDYMLEVLNPDGTYDARYIHSWDTVAYPPVLGAGAAAAAAPGPADDTVTRLIDQLTATQAKADDRIQTANDRMLTVVMESSRAQVTAITQMVAALSGQRTAQVDPVTLLDQLAGVIQKLSPAARAELGPADAMTLLEKGMDLGERVAGGAPAAPTGELLPGVTLKDLLGGILQIIGARRAALPPAAPPPARAVRVAVAPAAAAAAPSTASAPAAAAPPVDPESEIETTAAEVEEVKANPFYLWYVPKLLDRARAGGPAADTVDWIMGNAPVNYLMQFVQDAGAKDIVDILAVYEPAAADHAEWFRAVWAGICAEIQPHLDADPDEPPPAAPHGANGTGAPGADRELVAVAMGSPVPAPTVAPTAAAAARRTRAARPADLPGIPAPVRPARRPKPKPPKP